MEGGEPGLEESLVLFEEGIKLSRVLNKRLEDAERKVEMLVRDESGKPVNARVVWVNKAAMQIGNMRGDPSGRMIGDLFPGVFEERMAHVSHVASTGQPEKYEQFYPEFNRWMEVLAFCPQPNHFAITFTDITDRKTAEQALRESEQRRRALIEMTATGYVVLDYQGRVLDANTEYVRLTGYHNLEEIRGRCVLEWTAEYEKDKNAAAIAYQPAPTSA